MFSAHHFSLHFWTPFLAPWKVILAELGPPKCRSILLRSVSGPFWGYWGPKWGSYFGTFWGLGGTLERLGRRVGTRVRLLRMMMLMTMMSNHTFPEQLKKTSSPPAALLEPVRPLQPVLLEEDDDNDAIVLERMQTLAMDSDSQVDWDFD